MRISTPATLAVALLGAGLATTVPAAAQPGVERAQRSSTHWQIGAEIGRAAAAWFGWEATRLGWTLGAAAGLGPGSDSVRFRLTPSLRAGRLLPGGLRLDAGLGFETTWRSGAGNADETEIQWEATAGWSGPLGVLLEAGARRTEYRVAGWEALARVSVPVGAKDRSRGPAAEGRGTVPSPDGEPTDREPPDHEPPRGEPADGARAGPETGSDAAAPGRPAERTIPRAFGVPPAPMVDGRLRLGVEAPHRRGSGIVFAASNPHGDPDPWTHAAIESGNVDRLGATAVGWTEVGSAKAWVRWRSDLHTDTSISARIRPVARGEGFPVTIAVSGGGSWRGLGSMIRVGVRHDPRAFPWMPHLAEERTARVEALELEAAPGPAVLSATRRALEPIGGRTVERLDHRRAAAGWRRGLWTLGVEHQVLELGGEGGEPEVGATRRARRTRLAVSREGAWWGHAAAGSDAVLVLGVRSAGTPPDPGGWPRGTDVGIDGATPGRVVPALDTAAGNPADALAAGGLWGAAALELRTEPDLLEYDALLLRGWMRQTVTEERIDLPTAALALRAGAGSYELRSWTGWGLPLARGTAADRIAGGWLDARWSGSLGRLPGNGSARLRLAEWGPGEAWWRERATLEAQVNLPVNRGPARIALELRGRTALVSARSGMSEPGGMMAALALGGPLPELVLGLPGWAELRLADALDAGLAERIGAPRVGRRLTLLLSVGSGAAVGRP